MRIDLILALLCITPLHAQVTTPPAPSAPAFETVSIRPSHLTRGCYSMLPPGGSQYALTCVTLRFLIGLAYKADRIDQLQALLAAPNLKLTDSQLEKLTQASAY